MKSFSTLVVVRQPADRVFATVRDRLAEIATHVDDIASIVEVERTATDSDLVHIVNEWRSAQRVPELIATSIGVAEVAWIDRNEWDAATQVCRWSVEPLVFTDHVTCRGTTTYEPAMAGRGARVTVSGEFNLAVGAFGGMTALRRPVGAFVESIVSTMIPRNARKVIEAAAALLAVEDDGVNR